MNGAPLVVAGYFPPPFIGQGVATERLASLVEAARPVERVSLQNARGLGLDPDTPPSFAAGVSYLLARPEWRRALRSHPTATVLWTSLSPQTHGHLRDALLVLPAFLPSQRVFGVAHWGRFHLLGEHRGIQRSVRRLVRRLEGVVFLDEGLAARCAGFVPPDKRRIVPNTVGDDVIATAAELAAKRARRAPGAPLHVLFLSNMLPVKGPLDVLDATALLHRRSVPVRTTFAGRWTAPGDEGIFAARLAGHALPDGVVTHLGPVADRAAVRRLYLDADVFAFPTYYDSEAQPLTILEAFACGTPVVTTRQGGIPGMVTDGREGFLVPPRAPEPLADALARLADPATWRAASEAPPAPPPAMHVLVHDFGGYPYPAELSRALAARGHRVTHAYCPSLETTPGGHFARRPDDPERLAFVPLALAEPLAKYSFVKRWRQERHYGHLAAGLTDRLRPDVVVSANMPLDAQAILLRRCRRRGVPFVFWLQDVIGVAAHRLLRHRWGGLGALVGRYYEALEARLLRASDAVVPITDDFRPLLDRWRVDPARVTTVENWAPVADLPVRPKANGWAAAAGLADRTAFVYAGTMGLKHNPELLARLAERVGDRARVAVLSQGPGADHLRAAKAERGLAALDVRPYEPFERMPDVMGAADVLVAVLEPDAGVFSVPSKVLAYLCAGRALLLAVPPANLAARIVARERAGLVVDPGDVDGFVAAAERLLGDPAGRAAMGARARAYAERAFAIGAIADRFEDVLRRAVGERPPPGS